MVGDAVTQFPDADVFIETGFATGQTIAAVVNQYKEIHSIELDANAVAAGRRRFDAYPHVYIHYGSSPKWLPRLMDPLKRTVFWLDAHYSPNNGQHDPTYLDEYGQCPLIAELEAIFAVPWLHKPEIFIDDVVLFAKRDYTGTYAEGCDSSLFPTEYEVVALLEDHGYIVSIGKHNGIDRFYHARHGENL